MCVAERGSAVKEEVESAKETRNPYFVNLGTAIGIVLLVEVEQFELPRMLDGGKLQSEYDPYDLSA